MVSIDSILQRVTKPARYTGGEWNSVGKDWDEADVRVAVSYPDLYDIGMSNLGLAIIYDQLNRQEGVLAERFFAPWVDMEAEMRSAGIPLFSLESRRPMKDFDILGLSLGYELTYTNMLNLLDLAGLPVRAADRGDYLPLIIAGGSCALNAEPVAEFVDLFVAGEAEDVLPEVVAVFRRWKSRGARSKDELLRELAGLRGVYVPGFYHCEYNADGTLASITPMVGEAKRVIERLVVDSLPPPLTRPIVPYLQVVHDRAAVEIQRGCSHGCRFCQAGTVYRPVRERSHAEVVSAIDSIVKNCGYEEVSLLSLSTSDYTGIDELVGVLSGRYRGDHLALSLPSLRLDRFSVALVDSFNDGKKAGLTFAPEAGTQRLRGVINKGISEEDILETVETAWQRGWRNVKLYFMIGLPSETGADIEGIVHLVRKIKSVGKGRLSIRVNISTFVPKPHTAFQWVAQASEEDLADKQRMLSAGLRKAGVHLSWQDPKVSLLEGVLSRGDRRLSRVIERAWRSGCKFDAWSEHYSYEKWRRAFDECGVAPEFYVYRERAAEELLPWAHMDTGVAPAFLRSEYERAKLGQETPDCRAAPCNACGLQQSNDRCRKKHKETMSSAKRAKPGPTED